jgi:hypothetical protein
MEHYWHNYLERLNLHLLLQHHEQCTLYSSLTIQQRDLDSLPHTMQAIV